MRLALITDTHFGGRNDSLIFDRYFAKFYEEIFFPMIEKEGITRVIHLGDTFDRRKYVNFNTLYSCREYFFKRAEALGLKIDMIVGNHDSYYKNKIDVNSVDLLLGQFRNINPVSEPTTYTYDGTKICLMPWICKDNYDQAMNEIATTKAQILMGHLELKGFGMYRGEHNEHGYERDIFDKFDLVFTGHFHHKDSQGHISYLGSPYEMTWSDYDDDRGFHVFDTDTRELTFYKNPFKMFHKIQYNDVTQTIEELLDHDFTQYEGTMVKVVISEKSNPYAFSQFVDRLEKVNPANVSFVDDTLDLNFDDEDLGDVDDTPTFIKNRVDQLPQERLRKPLKKLMLSLHAEAINQTRV
jgi:DNA repair exonuclease SbcCD nuclease subunit